MGSPSSSLRPSRSSSSSITGKSSSTLSTLSHSSSDPGPFLFLRVALKSA
jgi:hypothetical protein